MPPTPPPTPSRSPMRHITVVHTPRPLPFSSIRKSYLKKKRKLFCSREKRSRRSMLAFRIMLPVQTSVFASLLNPHQSPLAVLHLRPPTRNYSHEDIFTARLRRASIKDVSQIAYFCTKHCVERWRARSVKAVLDDAAEMVLMVCSLDLVSAALPM